MNKADRMATSPELDFEGNLLLKALRTEDRALILPYLERLQYEKGQTVFACGTDVSHIIFPCAHTVASLVISMLDGRSAETATIGREGAVGGAVSTGGLPASTHGVIQIGGPALRMEAVRLQDARRHSETLNNLFTRYADCLLAQVLQSVACNALHPIEERCLRWLLALQDRLGTDVLPVTQDFLATMIGVQRTYLTRILRALQNQGLIEIGRGRLRIVSRSAVEAAACECHGCVKRHYDAVMGAVYGADGRIVAIEPPMRQRRGRLALALADGGETGV